MHKMMVLAAVIAVAIPATVNAANFRVEMKNRGAHGQTMVFEPRLLRLELGDTVTFVVKDKVHNSASFKDGTPSGASTWKGRVNEELTVTIDVPGVYLYQCTPHVGMGMVGAIVAGEPVNLQLVKNLKQSGE